MGKINEEKLHLIFQKLKSGDKSVLDDFYKDYSNIVFKIAYSILKNKENSDDVTQAVFEKMLKLEQDKFPTQFEASWLYTVTKNEVMQFLRKQKNNIDIDDLYTLESESDEIDDIVDMNSYYNLIKDLNPLDQEIISLRVLSDFTFDKIAQMKNLPLGTVQWRYYKSLHSIKLSIGNLLAFIVAYAVCDNIGKYSSNVSEEQNNNLLEENKTSSFDAFNSSSSNSGIGTSIESSAESFKRTDSSGAGMSVTNYIPSVIKLFSFVFLIIAIVFAVKKKIKIRKY